MLVSGYYFFQWPDGCQAIVDQSADNPLIVDQVCYHPQSIYLSIIAPSGSCSS
jgi:hypothetical protein